jgi:hypothetical protein
MQGCQKFRGAVIGDRRVHRKVGRIRADPFEAVIWVSNNRDNTGVSPLLTQ